MKTSIDILDEVYQLLDVPQVYAAMMSGDVFPVRKPDNYRGECIVINCLALTADQLQVSVVNVNIYAPNLKLTINGQTESSQPDRVRINTIAKTVTPILENGLINNMVTAIEAITLLPEENFNEHYLNIRVRIHSINL